MRKGARSYAELARLSGRTNAEVRRHIEEVSGLSETAIDALPLQPYLRQGLKEIKREQSAADFAQSVEAGITVRILSSDLGDVRRWIADQQFVPIARGGSIEILPNKLIWFPNSGGFWYETIYCRNVAPVLFQYSVFVRTCLKLDYMTMYRNEINGRIDEANNAIIDMTGTTPSTRSSIRGVRISSI